MTTGIAEYVQRMLDPERSKNRPVEYNKPVTVRLDSRQLALLELVITELDVTRQAYLQQIIDMALADTAQCLVSNALQVPDDQSEFERLDRELRDIDPFYNM